MDIVMGDESTRKEHTRLEEDEERVPGREKKSWVEKAGFWPCGKSSRSEGEVGSSRLGRVGAASGRSRGVFAPRGARGVSRRRRSRGVNGSGRHAGETGGSSERGRGGGGRSERGWDRGGKRNGCRGGRRGGRLRGRLEKAVLGDAKELRREESSVRSVSGDPGGKEKTRLTSRRSCCYPREHLSPSSSKPSNFQDQSREAS
jgi:hypothetical protein